MIPPTVICREGTHFGRMDFQGESVPGSGYLLYRCKECGNEVGIVR